ncbi:uncharacterized protein LOC133548689 [Nerophis ophidion]|uniref:uncharacterized protein LOC133548689 n=1 Tax=Nerophis ophidion TaxID=159077 RepID=UPI002ADF1D52|nr:uncharacterized protein LOC133548689 [Nerophis ophidion]
MATLELDGHVVHSEAEWRLRATSSKEASERARQGRLEAEAERRLAEKERQERAAECLSWKEKYLLVEHQIRTQEDMKALRQNKSCQAHIQTYFLCVTESDQRVKILKNHHGTPRSIMVTFFSAPKLLMRTKKFFTVLFFRQDRVPHVCLYDPGG